MFADLYLLIDCCHVALFLGIQSGGLRLSGERLEIKDGAMPTRGPKMGALHRQKAALRRRRNSKKKMKQTKKEKKKRMRRERKKSPARDCHHMVVCILKL